MNRRTVVVALSAIQEYALEQSAYDDGTPLDHALPGWLTNLVFKPDMAEPLAVQLLDLAVLADPQSSRALKAVARNVRKAVRP